MLERTVFRQTAVEAHRRGVEKAVIPRLVSRPITVGRWMLLALLIAVAALSWWVTIPGYVGASGVLVGQGDAQPLGAQTAAVLLLPEASASQVRVGGPVHIQVGSLGTVAEGAVSVVEPGVVTPDTARRRYPGLGPDLGTQPSVVVVVRLEGSPPSPPSAGTQVTAHVETRAQRLVALLPSLFRSAG